jgi:Protein of unknown function (DUF3105)
LANKKPKTPTPPRRPQAPQTRSGASDDMGGRARLILYAVAASGFIALIVVIAIVAFGGGSNTNEKAGKTIVAAGCRYKHYPAQARTPHYTTLNPSPPPSWNSFPPSSGRHFYQWVLWGDYTEPVPLIKEVHNLEHGGMIIHYGNKVPKSDISQIDAFWQKDPTAMLVSPLPKLGNKISMTAWTNWAECTRFNEKAFKAFQSAFRYHGPESSVFPKSSLQPGQ